MRKPVCCSLLLLLSLFIFPAPVTAQQVDWNLIWQDDGTIEETVRVMGKGEDLSVDEQDWKVIRTSGSNQVILTREVDDWAAYSRQTDRLPIRAETRDYIILQITRIKTEHPVPPSAGLYRQVAELSEARLSIQVPGIVREHSAYGVENSQKAIWKLNRLDHLTGEDLVVKAVVFDGLLLAVLLVGGAVLIIGWVFLRSIRRVNQLIEEEYSLENVQLDPIEEESSGSDQQKS